MNKLKTLILSLALLLTSQFVWGATTKINSLTYTYNTNNDYATVTNYDGNTANVEVEGSITVDGKTYTVTEVGINGATAANKKKLTSITLPESVKTLSANAFAGYSALTSINLPKGITSIPNYAFDGCTNLESIDLSNITSIGTYAFRNCSTLTNINLPEGITSIPNYAFYGCTSLKEIVIPTGVNTIGTDAFDGCTGLKRMVIPSSVVSIRNTPFSGCNGTIQISCNANPNLSGSNFSTIELMPGVTTISANQFDDLKDVHIIIPSSVKTINATSPFSNCTGTLDIACDFTSTNLTGSQFSTINIGEGVTAVPANAFEVTNAKNTKLSSVTLPSTITSLGTNSFAGYKGAITINCNVGENWFRGNVGFTNPIGEHTFTNVTISEGVTEIGAGAFQDCKSFDSISLPSTLTTLGAFAFCATDLTEISIPEGVTTMGNDVFNYCTALSQVELPSTLTTIGAGLFNTCTSLDSIKLPDGLTSLPGFTFWGCANLKSVTLPSGLVSLGRDDFNGCTSLKSIELPETLETIGEGAFNGSGITSIVIPEGVTTMDINTFIGCTSLTEVTLPSTLSSVGEGTFSGCSALKTVNMESIPAGFDNNSLPEGVGIGLKLTDQSTVGAPISKLKSISYTRKNIKSDWGSLVLPFACESVEGEYQLYQISGGDAENHVINFVKVDEVAANVPCLYKRLNGQTELTFSADVTEITPVVSPFSAGEGWGLDGTYEARTLPYDSYCLSSDKIYLVDSNVNCKCFRSWIVAPNAVSAAGIRNLTIQEVELETGMTQVLDSADLEGLEFSLAGQKTIKQQGMKIKNGKVIFVK